MTNLVEHLTRQMVFSRATFGPGSRTSGVLDHITREIAEVREANGSAEEWVDLVILALDGLTRQLWSANDYRSPAHAIAQTAATMIVGKQGKNELRDWPDWRMAPKDKAIEHIKGCPHCGYSHPPDGVCMS